jgi:hypothetical protein
MEICCKNILLESTNSIEHTVNRRLLNNTGLVKYLVWFMMFNVTRQYFSYIVAVSFIGG